MDAAFFQDPYANPRRARSILFGVLLMHFCVIAVPLIYASLTDFFDPPVIVMKVGLADLPLGDSPDAGTVAADVPSPKMSEPDPVSVDDIPDPQHVADLPPEPKIEPVVETPPVQTKVEPKVTPKVETPPVQTKVEPKTDPKPKTDSKPKTEQKKDPPKSTLLTADQIKKTNNAKTQAQLDAERKAREAAEAKAKADAKARQDAIAAIRDAAQQGRYGTTDPGQEGILATKEMRAYYEQLVAFIRPKWNAVSPSSVELDGKISNWPSVDLTISKKGEVTKAVVVSQSGNKAIDAAVKTLLADLKVVPAPPQAGVIRVTLDIR